MPQEPPPPILNREQKEIVNVIKLIHAVLVRALRGHGRRRDARGGSNIIYIADQSLRVEAEGFAHQTSDSVQEYC